MTKTINTSVKADFVSSFADVTSAETAIIATMANYAVAAKRTAKVRDVLAIQLADWLALSANEGVLPSEAETRKEASRMAKLAADGDSDAEARIMGAFSVANKAARLIVSGRGWTAGWHLDGQTGYCDQTAAHTKGGKLKDGMVPAVFHMLRETFPNKNVGTENAPNIQPNNDTHFMPAVEADISNAYRVQLQNADLEGGYKIKVAKAPDTEGVINTPKQARATAKALEIWLAKAGLEAAETSDKVKALDGATLKTLNDLANAIDKAIETNATTQAVATAADAA